MINRISILDEEDLECMDQGELALAQQDDTAEVSPSHELVLRGVQTKEEIDLIASFCSQEDDNPLGLPLYLAFEEAKELLGYLEFSLDSVLRLLFISTDYSLVLALPTGDFKPVLSPQFSKANLAKTLASLVTLH